MLEADESFRDWGSPSSPPGLYSPGEPCVTRSTWQNQVTTLFSFLLTPFPVLVLRVWGYDCVSAQSNHWCVQWEPAHQDMKPGFLNHPKRMESVSYTFEIYIYYFLLETSGFLPYSQNFWASNIFTNRYWLMCNDSQNIFLGSALLFWQSGQLVNKYSHKWMYRPSNFHIYKQCNQDCFLQ